MQSTAMQRLDEIDPTKGESNGENHHPSTSVRGGSLAKRSNHGRSSVNNVVNNYTDISKDESVTGGRPTPHSASLARNSHSTALQSVLPLPAVLRRIPEEPTNVTGPCKRSWRLQQRLLLAALVGQGGIVIPLIFINNWRLKRQGINPKSLPKVKQVVPGRPFSKVLVQYFWKGQEETSDGSQLTVKAVAEKLGSTDPFENTELAIDNPWMEAYLDWQSQAFSIPSDKVEWLTDPKAMALLPQKSTQPETSYTLDDDERDSEDDLTGFAEDMSEDCDPSESFSEATRGVDEPSRPAKRRKLVRRSELARLKPDVVQSIETSITGQRIDTSSAAQSVEKTITAQSAEESNTVQHAASTETLEAPAVTPLTEDYPNYLPGLRRYLPPFSSHSEQHIGLNMALLTKLVWYDNQLDQFDASDLEQYAELAADYLRRSSSFSQDFKHQWKFQLIFLEQWVRKLLDQAAINKERPASDAWSNPAICPFDEYPDECKAYWSSLADGAALSRDQMIKIGDKIKELQYPKQAATIGPLDGDMVKWLNIDVPNRVTLNELRAMERATITTLSTSRCKEYQDKVVDIVQIAHRYGVQLPEDSGWEHLANMAVTHYTTAQGGRPLDYRHCVACKKLAKAVVVGLGLTKVYLPAFKGVENAELAIALPWAFGLMAGKVTTGLQELREVGEEEENGVV